MMKPTSRTLLIVESHAVTLAALTSVFRSEGYQVLAASTSDEALEHLRRPERPNVVLFDLRDTPDHGERFLEARVQDETLASVPLVLLSEGAADSRWLASPGVAGSFQKPVALEPLISLMRQVE